jgi:LysR family glycine cleavage system transcriptional activator
MAVAPQRPKGPPLNALRAFEAAARLGGFALAAEELGVTPGAISQHIKTLEDWSGTPLFTRRSPGVRLTRTGADLLPGLTSAFDQLGETVRHLRSTRPRPVVQVATLPSVAQLWLSPRLPALRAAIPGVALSVTALERPPNLTRELFDLSIFLRPLAEVPTGITLATDSIFPVCAPALAVGLKSPADLAHAPLLHDETWAEDWPNWAAARGVTLPNASDGPRFSLYALALDAARQGAGVLMGHDCLVSDALTRGELVRPFPDEVPTGLALILDRPVLPGSNDRLADVIHALLQPLS